jgi:hypothetical protein
MIALTAFRFFIHPSLLDSRRVVLNPIRFKNPTRYIARNPFKQLFDTSASLCRAFKIAQLVFGGECCSSLRPHQALALDINLICNEEDALLFDASFIQILQPA